MNRSTGKRPLEGLREVRATHCGACQRESLVISDPHFAGTGGTSLFDGLSVVPVGATTLIGRSGPGKSALLRLIAGVLEAASGSVSSDRPFGVRPQNVVLDAQRTGTDVLGARGIVRRVPGSRCLRIRPPRRMP